MFLFGSFAPGACGPRRRHRRRDFLGSGIDRRFVLAAPSLGIRAGAGRLPASLLGEAGPARGNPRGPQREGVVFFFASPPRIRSAYTTDRFLPDSSRRDAPPTPRRRRSRPLPAGRRPPAKR